MSSPRTNNSGNSNSGNNNSNGNNNSGNNNSNNSNSPRSNGNITITSKNDPSFNSFFDPSANITDLSFSVIINSNTTEENDLDCSANIIIPAIVDFSLNTTIDGSGYEIKFQQGVSIDGSNVTIGTFDTTLPALYDPDIHENLAQVVTTYDDETNSQTAAVLAQIELYASQIQCSDFHGKGSIDDYNNLFNAAAKIANETKQMQLDIDIEGFEDFGRAADELSAVFNGFIIKLHQVNIIDDFAFLSAIASALSKIVNLSNIFGKFKETILATTTVKLPKSAHDTKVIIEGVMDEVNCAMQYIGHFVDASFAAPSDAELSTAEKNIIDKAVETIDNWNLLCEHGISVALENNTDIQYITHASTELKNTSNVLKIATTNLKNKLAQYKYC
jgi:hypothetical protein